MSHFSHTQPSKVISTKLFDEDVIVDIIERDQEVISGGFGLTYFNIDIEEIYTTASSFSEVENSSPNSGSPFTRASSTKDASYGARRVSITIGGLIPISSISTFVSNIIRLF